MENDVGNTEGSRPWLLAVAPSGLVIADANPGKAARHQGEPGVRTLTSFLKLTTKGRT